MEGIDGGYQWRVSREGIHRHSTTDAASAHDPLCPLATLRPFCPYNLAHCKHLGSFSQSNHLMNTVSIICKVLLKSVFWLQVSWQTLPFKPLCLQHS